MENWRFIEANSDYMVSDHGRILSFKGKSKLIISSSITAKGYEYVAIRQKGRRKSQEPKEAVRKNAF